MPLSRRFRFSLMSRFVGFNWFVSSWSVKDTNGRSLVVLDNYFLVLLL